MPDSVYTIPSTMRALELTAYDGQPDSLRLVERPVPQPGPGQVLVRMAASPINPSDLMFLQGDYGAQPKRLPVVPGWEGSGVVVGGAGLGAALRGRRVACGAPDDGDGTWAEYMVTGLGRCVPLRPGLSLTQGATLLVNPMTAWALTHMARVEGHRAVVNTAAAGALGRMIARLGRRAGLTILHIVRRPDQIPLLQAEGAVHILDSSAPAFESELVAACSRLDTTLAFDGVGGALTAQLLRALQPGGRVIVYGALAGTIASIGVKSLIFFDKRVEGFWLGTWLSHQPPWTLARAGLAAQGSLAGLLQPPIRARVPLAAAPQALAAYVAGMTAGKILFLPARRA